MRQGLFIFTFFISVISYSQNWNVFNKEYRYNYKFDNSALISNVLFVETYSLSTSDTVYAMNNIGVATGSFLVIDQPQFLMKKIIKLANGNVQLQDTANITIIPTCTLNQSWLFDANYNLTATCVSTSIELLFNSIDSVKTILVNNSDTIKLSKQFGIIQFPKLYNQNKYYRLVGIENKATYDLAALYGEKVPNAWDFYDFHIGYTWCHLMEYNIGVPNNGGCSKGSQTVKSKTVTPDSYVYNIDKTYIDHTGWMYYCASPSATNTFINTNLTYSGSATGSLGLSSPDLKENSYYPGFVPNVSIYRAAIVKLGKDNTGRFYKYIGPNCSSDFGFYVNPNQLVVAMPNQNEPFAYAGNFPAQCETNHFTWGVGVGTVSEAGGNCSGSFKYCTTCFGTVDLPDLKNNAQYKSIYPNPANTQLNLPINNGLVKLFDPLGGFIKEFSLEEKNTIDISALPNGLYFIEIQSDSFKGTQKLIIQH